MAQQTINVGTAPNDGTGTPLRTAFQYTNSNFSELYTALGGGSGLPGASTQVLFNNGTNIAGDAGLVYNSTTDALTIGGNVQAASATITGAANLNGAVNLNTAGSSTVTLGASSSYGVLSGSGTNAASIYINGATRPGFNSVLQFGAAEHQWYNSSLSSLIATLNSTGLGIGTASPATKLHIDTASAGYGLTLAASGLTGRRFQFGINIDANLAIYDTSAAAVRMIIDGSGNVGIGVTPSAWDTNYKALQLGYPNFISGNNGGNIIDIGVNAYFNTDWKYAASSVAATRYRQVVGVHQWFTAPSGTAGNAITWTQAMTLDASGNLLVGDTVVYANERIRSKTTTTNYWSINMESVNRGWLNRQSDSNGGIAAYFEVGAGTNVGSITTTSSGTSFVTTSDYRLKESVQPLVGGIARVSALKPSIYKWKIDGSNGEGFLAHELAEVVPFAVTGEKDAVNEDGSIKPQGVDLSKIVPVLVAAIQELAAEVNALKNA